MHPETDKESQTGSTSTFYDPKFLVKTYPSSVRSRNDVDLVLGRCSFYFQNATLSPSGQKLFLVTPDASKAINMMNLFCQYFRRVVLCDYFPHLTECQLIRPLSLYGLADTAWLLRPQETLTLCRYFVV